MAVGEPPGRGRVDEAPRIQLQLPARPDSPGVARRELVRLESAVDRILMARLRLIVTELVTNCVYDQDDGVVLVEVVAGDELIRGEIVELNADGEPRPPEASPFRRGGLARALVRSLGDRIGALEDRRGMWFEIDRGRRH